jgi:alpha-1,3-rhamnosyl/mannosyltransferase
VTRYVLDARTATDHFPGVGRYVFNLAQAMASLLNQAEVLILLRDPTQSSPWSLTGLVGPQVEVVDVPCSPFSLRQQWVLPRLLQRLQANLYHSPYYLMPYWPGPRAVVTIHDLIPLLYPDYFTANQRLMFKLTVRLAVSTATKVIAVSKATTCDLKRYLGLAEGRVVTIFEAADPVFAPASASARAALRQRLDLPDKYVLYLGSNKPHKNLVRLVEAWAQIQPQPLPLVVAGVWDARYPQARQQAEALQLGEAIRFLGPVAEVDLPALYSSATAFVFPSEYEGFGLPVLEAMACGLPTACANTSSLAEVAGDAALTFDPYNVPMIAHTLKHLLADADLCAALWERGLRQAAQFSWSWAAQKTLDIYRQLV